MNHLKPGFHKANFDYYDYQFLVRTKRLVGRMIAQPHNRFVFCVVVVEFAVNGNQALLEWCFIISLDTRRDWFQRTCVLIIAQ